MNVPDVTSRGLSELLSLSGRVAVVTGAARGIGLAIARRFAEAGADVLLADRSESEVVEAAASVAETCDTRCIAATVDVSHGRSVAALADRAIATFGQLDIWVNNAGIYPIAHVLETSERQWTSVVDVNLKGAFLGAREAARRMIDAGSRGVIINLSSVAGYRASPIGGADYVSAKHGIRGLTKALAAQLGQYGIRVIALAPATVDTPGIEESRRQVAALGAGQIDDHVVCLLGRVGVPDDIARVAVFCASDMAILMTGCTIPIDGGALALL